MNSFLRSILINNIKKGINEAMLVSAIDQPYLIGKLREIVLSNLITPLLNNRYSCGTGKVVDYKGDLSKEVDICIYSKNIHPPFFFSLNESLSVFPIESVLCCIEVKSTFSKTSLTDAYQKFKFLDDKLTLTPGVHESDIPQAHTFIKPKYEFFAFSCGPKKYTPSLILELYKHIDPLWETKPLITSICITHNGWICYTNRGWYHMAYDKKNKINEEVIGYLCCNIQSLSNVESSRGIPRIGYYLSDSCKMDKLVGGKKMKNTWKDQSVIFSNTSLSVL